MSPSKKYASEEGEAGSRKRNGRNEKKALESVLSAIEIRGDRYGVPLLLIFAFESLVKRVIVRPVLLLSCSRRVDTKKFRSSFFFASRTSLAR